MIFRTSFLVLLGLSLVLAEPAFPGSGLIPKIAGWFGKTTVSPPVDLVEATTKSESVVPSIWGKFTEAAGKIGEKASDAAGKAIGAAKQAGEKVTGTVAEGVDKVTGTATKIGDKLTGHVEEVSEKISNEVEKSKPSEQTTTVLPEEIDSQKSDEDEDVSAILGANEDDFDLAVSGEDVSNEEPSTTLAPVSKTQKAIDKMQKGFLSMLGKVKTHFGKFQQKTKDFAEKIKAKSKNVANKIKEKTKIVGQKIKTKLTNIKNRAAQIFNRAKAVLQRAKAHGKVAYAVIRKIFQQLKLMYKAQQSGAETLKNIQEAVNGLEGTLKDIKKDVKDGVKGAVNNAKENVKNTVESAKENVKGSINNVKDAVGGKVKDIFSIFKKKNE